MASWASQEDRIINEKLLLILVLAVMCSCVARPDALDIEENTASEESLKSAHKTNKLLDKVSAVCRKSNENINIQAMCLRKYFFFDGRPVHPKIIEEFNTWLSDGGDQVVAINLEDSQGSNKYCCRNDGNARISTEGKLTVDIDQNDVLGKDINRHPSVDDLTEILKLQNNRISKSDKKRIYLEKLYVFPLGDRRKHSITIDGNFLVLDGNKIDLISLGNF